MDIDILFIKILYMSFSGGPDNKESVYSAGDPSLIHRSGRSPGAPGKVQRKMAIHSRLTNTNI